MLLVSDKNKDFRSRSGAAPYGIICVSILDANLC